MAICTSRLTLIPIRNTRSSLTSILGRSKRVRVTRFSATAGEQQLAQIGFIVIQVGHRGGTPGRSKAYAGYGYFNLRDYALADKKAAIEQLAQRFPFIDAERVGMYGHSVAAL